jgi:DNA-binding MltR family transcriptional regulator
MTWAIFNEEPNTAAIGELLSSTSDRVVAVVGRALLDEHVRRTLRRRLRASGVTEGLLKQDAPLGNVGPKIDLLYLLHAFERPVYQALKAIAGVRNFFAHELDASFQSQDPRLLAHMDNLSLHKSRSHYPHHLFSWKDTEAPIEQINNNRDQFIANLKLGLLALMQDRVSHHKNSNERLTPQEIEEKYRARAARKAQEAEAKGVP